MIEMHMIAVKGDFFAVQKLAHDAGCLAKRRQL